jgi:serine/threonine-protein kinase
VSSAGSTGLEPGLVISSRYRVDERLANELTPHAYRATDTQSSERVLVLVVEAPAYKAITKAKGLNHAHVAKVLELCELDGKHLIVCEEVPGETLSERLAAIGKKAPVDAVRSALRVADALATLHEAGAAHGLVHPDNIVLEPEGREGPVLALGPIPSDLAYRQPEWEPGDSPSEPDDSWGVAALLHVMLLGEAPPRGGYELESAIGETGVDGALKAALFHALAKDRGVRSHDLRPLKRELARWFVEHAGEDIPDHPHNSTTPPPLPVLPVSLAPTSARRSMATSPSPKKPSRILVLAVAGISAGLIGGWVFSAMRHPKVKVVEVPKAAPPEESAKAIDMPEVPVTGESQSAGSDKVGSCVAGYMPKGTFDKAPAMSWVCDNADPRDGAGKLRGAVINGGKGNTTDAMKIFARLGWYDMAAYAMVRAGCCENPKPLTLPPPSASCTPMDEALRDLGSTLAATKPYEDALKKYTAAIHCELNANQGAKFGRTQRPAGGEDTAFGELVHSVQQ